MCQSLIEILEQKTARDRVQERLLAAEGTKKANLERAVQTLEQQPTALLKAIGELEKRNESDRQK